MTRRRKKHPGGRPPLPPGEARSTALLVRMRPADRAALDAWAGDRALGPLLVETALEAASQPVRTLDALYIDGECVSVRCRCGAANDGDGTMAIMCRRCCRLLATVE